MTDSVSYLRSLAAMPTISDSEGQTWRDGIAGLDPGDFQTLMHPLLAEGRRRLLGLPDWSRTVLFERFLRETPT